MKHKRCLLLIVLFAIVLFPKKASALLFDSSPLRNYEVAYSLSDNKVVKSPFNILLTTSKTDNKKGIFLGYYDKIKNLKSSNKKVVTVKKGTYPGNTGYGKTVFCYPRKAGSSKISFSYYDSTKGKWKKVSGKIKVVNYTDNPFKEFSIMGFNAAKYCTSYSGMLAVITSNAGEKENKNRIIKCHENPGWKIKNMTIKTKKSRFDSDKWTRISASEFKNAEFSIAEIMFSINNERRNISIPVKVIISVYLTGIPEGLPHSFLLKSEAWNPLL